MLFHDLIVLIIKSLVIITQIFGLLRGSMIMTTANKNVFYELKYHKKQNNIIYLPI